MENIVREIREVTGMSQEMFAREIGRSTPSLRVYESGRAAPDDVIEKLKTIATAHGRADLAVALGGGEFKVRRVIEPGETLIGAAREQASKSGNKEDKVEDTLREYWHTMLDQVLDSGQADAVNAVQFGLLVAAERVHLKGRKVARKLGREKLK